MVFIHLIVIFLQGQELEQLVLVKLGVHLGHVPGLSKLFQGVPDRGKGGVDGVGPVDGHAGSRLGLLIDGVLIFDGGSDHGAMNAVPPLFHATDGAREGDEAGVGAGVQIGVAAVDGLLQVIFEPEGVGTGDDHKVLVLAGLAHGVDVVHHDLLGHVDGAGGHVLADDAVLHLDAGGSGRLKLMDGAPDITGVEPPVVHVADEGEVHLFGDLIGQGEQILQLHQSHIGQEELGRAGDKAAGVYHRKAGCLDELGAEQVIGTQDRHTLRGGHQLPQANSLFVHIHSRYSPF